MIPKLKQSFAPCKAGFPLGEFVRANKQKANGLGGDVVSVCRQPIKLLLSQFARTNSPSGKPALGHLGVFGFQIHSLTDFWIPLLGYWIPLLGFRIPLPGFRIPKLIKGWIPDYLTWDGKLTLGDSSISCKLFFPVHEDNPKDAIVFGIYL